MSSTIKKTVGERIVDLFVAEGISHIFSIPDPGYMGIQHHALKNGIKVVAPRHESAGAMMADGVSRMSGHMSVVMAAEGPGVANIAIDANGGRISFNINPFSIRIAFGEMDGLAKVNGFTNGCTDGEYNIGFCNGGIGLG